jgi:ribosomal protein S1
MANAKITMDELLASAPESANQLNQGETIEGKVLSVRKHEILIDLGVLVLCHAAKLVFLKL